MIIKKKPQKVFVALSGGLDSAVAAGLLKKKGYLVSGAYMKLWVDEPKSDNYKEEEARKIAEIIGIPFYVFDFGYEFRKNIVDSFIEGYRKGLTPNPCVDCNQKIKFDLFWREAHKFGADLMATGHYARIKKRKNIFILYKGVDPKKDQSYFLWRMNQEQLSRVIFPLGNHYKKNVRKLAKKWKLPVDNKRESMEICFIPKYITDFLKKYLNIMPGNIMEENSGKIIAQHNGLFFYTIGQRKRIGLSGGPYYVRNKDINHNLLIVTKDKKSLERKDFLCHQTNLINIRTIKCPIRVRAKIRYSHKPTKAIIDEKGDDIYDVIFKVKQSAITPGQSVVFYRRSRLLGGGIIMSDQNVSI